MSEQIFKPHEFLKYKLKINKGLTEVLKGKSGKEPQNENKQTPQAQGHSTLFWNTLKVIIAALFIALIIRTFIIQIYYVPSDVMEPTLIAGDIVIVNKLSQGITNPLWRPFQTRKMLGIFSNPFYNKRNGLTDPRYIFKPSVRPSRMDIVIFIYSSKTDENKFYIRRVIGFAGEQIKIRKGKIYINGKQLKYKYPYAKNFRDLGPLKVPDNSFFVMGDSAIDRRGRVAWVVVRHENLVGNVLFRIWPVK